MALVEVEPLPGADAAGVVRVTLNRPERRNAVSTDMLAALGDVLGRLAVDPSLRAVVLAGAGPDFCAGADLGELAAAPATATGAEYTDVFDRGFRALTEVPVPVIASVQGAALGGGCQLVVACDLAVAADDARLGIPSARLGLVIGYENIERLVLAVGAKRAGELLLAGRILTGAEAASWGLVTRAVDPADLEVATAALAREVAEAAPLSVRTTKRGIGAALDHLRLDRFAEGHRLADFDMMAAQVFGSEDLAEGIRALRERRPPRFRGT